MTDDVKAGEIVSVYQHLYPHTPHFYVRPTNLFEGYMREPDGKEYARFKPMSNYFSAQFQ